MIFFPLNVGVKQLDNLSPSLFKIFVNDLPSYLPNTSDPVNVNVNTSKIKILIFNKAGRLIKHSFSYGNENIECVSNCKYLGIWFSLSGSHSYAQNELYKKIGLIVWSNTCMLVLIFGLSDSRSFFNLKKCF